MVVNCHATSAFYIQKWQSVHAHLQKVIFRNGQVLHKHLGKQSIEDFFIFFFLRKGFLDLVISVLIALTCCLMLSRNKTLSWINNFYGLF